MKKKVMTKLVVAVILTVIICLISNGLMPLLGNDVALGQLEHDDAYFVAMNTWYTINYWMTVATAVVWIVTGGLITKDIYKYIKIKKENM